MNENKWTAENIGDQTGKIVIVTGASSGIGYEAAKVLANKGAEVIIAVRNINKGNNAVENIIKQNEKAKVKVMIVDLANLKSIHEFAEKFISEFNKLDILINNAGVMIPPYSKTADGFELQFGTNHLGHFALTALLYEKLKATPNSRIVNVASMAHKYGNINFEDLNWENREYKAWSAYGDSKIANLYFTYQLKEKFNSENTAIKVTAAHPGWTATELQRHSGLFQFLNKFFAMNGEQGALPTLRAATDENTQSGDYFGPNGFKEWKGYPVKVKSNELSHNMTIAKKLWEVSERLTNTKF